MGQPKASRPRRTSINTRPFNARAAFLKEWGRVKVLVLVGSSDD
jgi:hypothetical protein